MNKLSLLLIFILILPMSGCGKKIVDDFSLKVGENTITTTADFSDQFALNLDGSFDIDIEGVNYGQIFLNAADDESPFQVGVTANFESFTSDVWDGFGPAETLPNGDPLPGWVDNSSLVEVDVPNFNENFGLTFYIGYEAPYYLGVAVSLNFLDAHYPEGLTIAQNFKKESAIWSGVTVFGPTYDSEGAVLQHGGIFFIATFHPSILEEVDSLFMINSNDSDLIFHDSIRNKSFELHEAPKGVLRKLNKIIKKIKQ
ncbi:MAG: hypothetical protein HOJ35_02060 [Bdellovibrionales bacterium]|nr:hypothetical protein [Bdellovibrionales bacterium]